MQGLLSIVRETLQALADSPKGQTPDVQLKLACHVIKPKQPGMQSSAMSIACMAGADCPGGEEMKIVSSHGPAELCGIMTDLTG